MYSISSRLRRREMNSELIISSNSTAPSAAARMYSLHSSVAAAKATSTKRYSLPLGSASLWNFLFKHTNSPKKAVRSQNYLSLLL